MVFRPLGGRWRCCPARAFAAVTDGTRILTGGLRWITFRVSAARLLRLQAFAVGAGQWFGQVWRGSASGGGCMVGTLPGPRGGPAGRDIGSTGVWRATAFAGAAQTAVRRGGVRRRPADRGCGGGRHHGLGACGDAPARGSGRVDGQRRYRAGRRGDLRWRYCPTGRAGHNRGKYGVCAEYDPAEGAFRAQAKGQWRAGWRGFGSGGFSGGVF